MRITLDYKTIILLDNPKEEEIFVKFMKIGESQIAYSTITRISEFKFTYKKGTEKDKFPTIESIEFDETNEFAEEQFEQIIDKSLHHLHHIITKKPIVYLHSGMKIPLQGLIFIGIVDRDTNCIEVKPLTGCNLNCIYCSVDEGPISKKEREYIIEKDFLIEELRKHIIKKLELGKEKNSKIPQYEIHIGTQGEPMFYEPIVEFVRDIKALNNDIAIKELSPHTEQIKTISMDSNGVLWAKEIADNLIAAGLNQINISLNAFTQEKANEIAGAPYAISKVKEIIEHIAKNHIATNPNIKLIIAPILLKKINEEEVIEIIKYIKELQNKYCKDSDESKQILPGLQNFLFYKGGRNPTKEIPWKKFRKKLERWETEFDIKLQLNLKNDFGIVTTDIIPRPMKKLTIISPKYVCEGPNNGEKICSMDDRLLLVTDFKKPKDLKEVKVYRTKHNIFMAAPEIKKQRR